LHYSVIKTLLPIMLHRELTVQECDATADCAKTKFKNSKRFIHNLSNDASKE